ncbi:hypothetical protein [Dyadobacter sp. MSC1_007]|jgi:hypothetical protein|uniref:hypothetical protein n=1 Tax=Dyadobacter sp. MSC1_007 TaxID=2909264 RepID=UPI00202F4D4B|nr:hypothetical protein [Dyadobacter sp. MSC1_007]
MKTVIKFAAVIWLTMTSVGCGENRKSKALIKANALHLQSVEIHEKLEKKLETLKAQAISQRDSAMAIKIDSLSNLIGLWEEGIVEVPGFAHEHHDHDKHEHKPSPEMTDESMLEYQQSTKEAIQQISNAVDQITN